MPLGDLRRQSSKWNDAFVRGRKIVDQWSIANRDWRFSGLADFIFLAGFLLVSAAAGRHFAWDFGATRAWRGMMPNSTAALAGYMMLSSGAIWLVLISSGKPWLEVSGAVAFALVLQIGVLANQTYWRIYDPGAKCERKFRPIGW